MIIPMEKKHAKEVAELHYKYTKSLLRDMEKRMCIIFYETVLKSDNNFGFVYVENHKVHGFVFGTTDNSRMFKSPRISLQLGITLIKKPYLLKKIFFRLSKRLPSGPESSYLAVDSELRGKGIGKQLLLALWETFRKRGIESVIGWIEEDNKPNLVIHQKLGAKIIGEFWEDGERKFIIHIPTILPK